MANWRPLFYVATGNKPTDDPYTWIDYTRYLRDDRSSAITTTRGRQDETQHHNNGTMTATLDNRDRTFVRDNNAWVQSDTPVQYLLEYPWLPGRIPNGGFEKGIAGWSPNPSAVTFVAQTNSNAADAGGTYLRAQLNSGQGFITNPIDLTGPLGFPASGGDTYSDVYVDIYSGTSGTPATSFPQAFVISFRGITTAPSTQVKVELLWYRDPACATFLSVDTFTLTVDELYWDGITPPSLFEAWKRVAFQTTSPTGAYGARVRFSNVSAVAGANCYFDSVVLDIATFEGTFPQYTGYANGWPRTWEVGDAICNLSGEDGFKALGKTKFSSQTYSQFILHGGDFSTGVIAEDSITRIPDHYYQLNEAGANGQSTSFKDSITGDLRALSVIGEGVGPLYQVAGLVPTDAAFSFSSLGPSSSDGGWIEMPTDFSLGANGSSWAAATWCRVIDGTKDVEWIFTQGSFDTLAGFHLPLSADGCVLYVAKSVVVGSTAQNLNFQIWSGFNQISNTFTANSGFISVEIHNGFGINFFDQAPHLVGVIVQGNHVELFVDGQKVKDVVTGTAVTDQTTRPQLFLGKGTGYYSQVGDSVWVEQLEYQHFMEWTSGLPVVADMAALYTRAITMYPQEDSGSRLQHVLDIVHWPGSLRNIDVGSSQIEKVTAPFSDEAAHSYNQKIEDAEQGWMFMGKDGRFRWKNRQSFFKNRTSTATFGTGAGELPYADVTITDDDSIIYNQGIVSRTNNAPKHQADDFVSQDEHFISTLQRTDLPLVSEVEAQAAAESIPDKYGTQKSMLTQVVLEATAGTQVGADEVLHQIMVREIGDRITVRTREPGQVGHREWVGLIQGIGHKVNRGKLTCTWDVTTLAVRDYFLFGDIFGSYPMGW